MLQQSATKDVSVLSVIIYRRLFGGGINASPPVRQQGYPRLEEREKPLYRSRLSSVTNIWRAACRHERIEALLLGGSQISFSAKMKLLNCSFVPSSRSTPPSRFDHGNIHSRQEELSATKIDGSLIDGLSSAHELDISRCGFDEHTLFVPVFPMPRPSRPRHRRPDRYR